MRRLSLSLSALYALWLLLPYSLPALGQEEYTFDLSEIEKEIEKKAYTFGGFLELRPVFYHLNRDSAFYRIRFGGQDKKSTLEQYNFGLRLEGSYQKEITGFYFRADSLLWHNDEGWDKDFNFLEGYLSLKPAPSFTLDLGKKVLPWGKGYAFNPVAFVSRPKDPEDPTEALEGFFVFTADWIKSFKGPLKTLAFTPVVLPVSETVNDDFGRPDHINFAAKFYFLLWNTDLDLLFFTGGSRTTRYGFDFSRNLKTNFEIHGELTYVTDFDQKTIDQQGNLGIEKSDVVQSLLGFRYLTTNDMTFIVEYYHNGGGLEKESADNFFDFVDRAYDTFSFSGDSSRLSQAARLAQGTLGSAKPMRDYLYFRASWKEPYDILYFNPALTVIWNLADQSSSTTLDLVYSPKTNLEIRMRGTILAGDAHTEYGEKLNDYKIELRVRYYFDVQLSRLKSRGK